MLAYSTVSQLGYMFLAVGSGAYVAAIFHMVTHAFFKALLFLGSGSVIHGMHDEQDMRRMGVLRKFMPITAATFIVGWLAIAGVPPFAGFWSKDEILLFALDKSPALYVVGLVTALLTAYYMTRQVIMVFFGEARWEDRADEHGAHGDFKPHESPAIMLVPARRARRSLDRRRRDPAAVQWLPDSSTGSPHWLEPVVEFGEANIAGTWADDNKTILMLDRHGRRRASASSSPGSSTQQARVKAIEPAILANAWYYDQAVSDFMGGPGREAFEAAAWFDAQRHRRRRERRRPTVVRGTAGELRKGQSGLRAQLRRRSSASASSLLLAWFVVVRGHPLSAESSTGLPDPHRRSSLRARRRRARVALVSASAGPSSSS